jgi:CubicO group peptidase (beta-lactamase class C family)
MVRTAVTALVVLLAAASCSTDSTDAATTSAPAATVSTTDPPNSSDTATSSSDVWPTSTPEEQGVSSRVLAQLFDEVAENGHGIDTVTVIRNGSLVAHAAVDGFRDGELHIVHSVTKSIVSTLVGIAIDEGHLEGVDQRVVDVFADRAVANRDARKEQMTIEDLLTMTTGFDCRDSYLYRWEGLDDLRQSEDWVQHVLDLPMVATPGEQFEYCNRASFLLSAVVQETTGTTAEQYAADRLFGAIGVTDFVWPANPDGISIGWGSLRMAPLDLARFGLLILGDGQWQEQQVVPAEWIDRATQPHVHGTLQPNYGYQWWIRDDGVVQGLGYEGQYLIIDRELNMVTVFTSKLPDEEFYLPDDLYDRYVLSAVKADEPLPSDPDAVDALLTAIDRW